MKQMLERDTMMFSVLAQFQAKAAQDCNEGDYQNIIPLEKELYMNFRIVERNR